MDASSETINLETPAPEKPKHNHVSQFGRYVAGCEACIAKHPDGPPERKRRTKAEIAAAVPAAAPQVTHTMLTPASVATDALVQIMLRKEAKEALEVEQTEARRQQGKLQMRRIVEQEKAMKKAAQDACNHRMERGENAVQGQVHNDGLYHGLCVRCLKEFPGIRPHASDLVGAL